MIDANIILRIILNDDAIMSEGALEFIDNHDIFIKNEVLAEVIHVLSKVYQKERADIYDYLYQVITAENVATESNKVILFALESYRNINLDFVDCLL